MAFGCQISLSILLGNLKLWVGEEAQQINVFAVPVWWPEFDLGTHSQRGAVLGSCPLTDSNSLVFRYPRLHARTSQTHNCKKPRNHCYAPNFLCSWVATYVWFICVILGSPWIFTVMNSNHPDPNQSQSASMCISQCEHGSNAFMSCS